MITHQTCYGREGRDLVITVKHAQFLIDRAQSGTNRLRMLQGVSWKKKLKKEVKKNSCYGRDQGVI